jgi:hypothetical protein
MERSNTGDQGLVDRRKQCREQIAGPSFSASSTSSSKTQDVEHPRPLVVPSDAEEIILSARDPTNEVKASTIWERAIKKMQQTPEWAESLGKL